VCLGVEVVSEAGVAEAAPPLLAASLRAKAVPPRFGLGRKPSLLPGKAEESALHSGIILRSARRPALLTSGPQVCLSLVLQTGPTGG
jgi:hypothetical protein